MHQQTPDRHDAVAGLLAAVAVLGLLACGPEPVPAAADAGPTAEVAGTSCPAERRGVQDDCCPPGTIWVHGLAACQGVGPPSCLGQWQSDDCTPRWCFDLLDDAGEGCAAVDLGCRPAPRPCTEAEISAGAGCPAAQYPDQGGVCRPAGVSGAATVAQSGSGPVPPLPALPPVGVPRWCQQGNEPVPCGATGGGCPAGTSPAEDGCVPAGVPWTCPKGFIVATAAPPDALGLPPCVPDPADCGAGPWRAGLPDSGVLYVDAAAKPGGTGGKAAPFRLISSVIKKVGPGDIVALAAGTYVGPIVLKHGVQWVGRCAHMSRIVASVGPTVGLTVAGSDPATVTDLTLSGDVVGVWVSGGARFTGKRLWLPGSQTFGVYVSGAGSRVTLEQSVVANTATDPGLLAQGNGLAVGAGAELIGRQLRLHRNGDVAALAIGKGSRLQLEETVIDATLATPKGAHGRGVEANSGAQLIARAVRVVANAHVGISIRDPGPESLLEGVRVEGGLGGQSTPTLGRGVSVSYGARAILRGVALAGVRTIALDIHGVGTEVRAGGVRVQGVLAGEQELGYGLRVAQGATAACHGTRIDDARVVGVVAADPGSQLVARDLVVVGTQPRVVDSTDGIGMHVSSGATLDLYGARLSQNHFTGLAVEHTGTVADVAQLIIDDTRAIPIELTNGIGLAVSNGGLLRGADIRLSGNRSYGMIVGMGHASAEVSRLLVDGTRDLGIGLAVSHGGHVTLRDARLSHSRTVGVLVQHQGTWLRARDLLVDEISGDDKTLLGGSAISVVQGAQAAVERARFTRGTALAVEEDNALTRLTLAGVHIDATRAAMVDGGNGNGVQVSRGSWLLMVGCHLFDNRYAGVVVGLKGSHATVAGCRISATHSAALPGVARPEFDPGGVGAAAIGSGRLELLHSVVEGSHTGGVLFHGGHGLARGCVIRDTKGAPYRVTDKQIWFGDGVLIHGTTDVQVLNTFVANSVRAGVLVSKASQIDIGATRASANAWGLALEQADVDYPNANGWFNNSIANVAGDLTLPVPLAPSLAK